MSGVSLIAAERKRQEESEGWDSTHDDMWERNELARAATCYILSSRFSLVSEDGEIPPSTPPPAWPWDDEWWKPSFDDPVRDLVKAGALIAAEIDRLEREREK